MYVNNNKAMSNSSKRDFSAPLSIKHETKEKFDAILKAAIKNKKQSKSKENLLSDSTTASSDNLVDFVEDSDYILNKFYYNNNSDNEEKEIEETTQQPQPPPVPKPRTKHKLRKSGSQSSTGTFVIKEKSSESSNKTYNKNEKTVEVIVHKKSTLKYNAETLQFGSPKGSDEVGEDIELSEISKKDSIHHEDEIKPKAKPRRKQTKGKEEKLKKEAEVELVEETPIKTYKYEKIIEVIIHKTDKLLLDSLVIHPVVKIHFVDAKTGLYLKKSDKNRNVVFFYENKECNHIVPIMTRSYNLQKERSLFPQWEETVILNEDFNYFKEHGENTIIFFEILDFVSFSVANQSNVNKSGWHKIAFAFLRPIVKNGNNLEKKLRLQLYHPPQGGKEEVGKCHLWQHWINKKLEKYPSTLYVTIKPVISPGQVLDVLRSRNTFESESSKKRLNLDDVKETPNAKEDEQTQNDDTEKKEIKEAEVWTRKPYETCKFPNKLSKKLGNFDKGCLVLKFSNNGLFLACAGKLDKYFGIAIYSVKNWDLIRTFSSHQGLIYGICWSKDDSLIILPSSDNTVSIWNFRNLSFFQVLPHPAFVYDAKISNNNEEIATGGYDKTLRIWLKDNNKYNLFQELDGHRGFITSICFNDKGNILLSSDSCGSIIEWKKSNNWTLNRNILLLDLRDVIINQIILYHNERKLLINSRDSTLRIVDLKTTCILHWLIGGVNKKVQTFASLTPCENFIYCGSDNGFINVWKAKTGHLYAKYEPYDMELTVNCVEFHPLDNIMAVSSYGSDMPVLIYHYEKDQQENESNCVQILRGENTNGEGVEDKQRDSKKILSWIEKKNKKKVDIKEVLQKLDEVIISQRHKE